MHAIQSKLPRAAYGILLTAAGSTRIQWQNGAVVPAVTLNAMATNGGAGEASHPVLTAETMTARSGKYTTRTDDGFAVLIPAYQETESISSTLEELLEFLPLDGEAIVGAADTSENGVRIKGENCLTGKQALSGGDRRVRVCAGGGLSEAVGNAARMSRHDLVVVMDADGQHDPAVVGKMISRLREGFDVCVGELTQDGKPWYRVALTFLSSLLARLRMPLRTKGLRFPQSGFFATRRSLLVEALERIGPYDSKPLTAVLMLRPLSVSAIRTTLRSRMAGRSKVSWRIIASDALFLTRRCGR